MNDTLNIILESWDRQCKILDNMTQMLNPELMASKPSENGWTIFEHFAHILSCRKFWIGELHPRYAEGLTKLDGTEGLVELRSELSHSSQRVHEAVRELSMSDSEPGAVYEHPLFFLQHMLWHEGYHFGLIMLALRKAGHEPSETWEEENVWSLWRTDPWFAEQAQK